MWATVKMSIVTHRRGRRTNRVCEHSGVRSRREANLPAINIDDIPEETREPSVDLTSPDIVDLTSPNVILDRMSGQRSRRHHSGIINLDSDGDFTIINLDSSELESDVPDSSPQKVDTEDDTSPTRKKSRNHSADCDVICNICLDSVSTICRSSRMLMSTNCGHVFCSSCLKAVMQQQQRKCPSCRKTLTERKIHPLYI